MKKVKIALGLIIIVFLAILFFSNKDYFLAKQGLRINLLFGEPYQTKELPNAIFFLFFFLSGFLIAYFFSLYDRFKCKKAIKNLDATTASQLEEISALKSEIGSIKGGSSTEESVENGEEPKAGGE